MIVFDLVCSAGHVFEAWFGSSAAFDEQRSGGLLACPLCGVGEVEKAVMAPNVGMKGNRRVASPTPSAPPPATVPEPSPEMVKAVLAKLASAQAKALEGSTWVGSAFADRARAMHLGEADHAPIHGRASIEQAKELIEEGVPVAPLPLPVVPHESRN